MLIRKHEISRQNGHLSGFATASTRLFAAAIRVLDPAIGAVVHRPRHAGVVDVESAIQFLSAHQWMPSDTDLTEDLSRQFGRPRG
jgi:hypothetical protein